MTTTPGLTDAEIESLRNACCDCGQDPDCFVVMDTDWPTLFAAVERILADRLDHRSSDGLSEERRDAPQSEPTTTPEWVERAVTLYDHFDGRITLRVAQPQPQYGTVQLNAEYKGDLISVDVNLAALRAALDAVTEDPDGPQ